MTFNVGDKVIMTFNSISMFTDTNDEPGVITSVNPDGSYGVVSDFEPIGWPMRFEAKELKPRL